MRPVHITDTTLRDAHQSLWATRMNLADMLPILPKMDSVGYWSLEVWGGATFDAALRFLDENPWDRLRIIKHHAPKTPLQMLLRGQNLVGYRHYSDDIVRRFVHASKRNGIDVFRIFDALNDIRNVEVSAAAVKECGGHFEGAISYTVSPVHTLDSYLEYAQELKDIGADTICIKDMAGMLTPFRTAKMVSALKDEIGLPVHVHCHYIGGMAPMNYLKGVEAGADIIDTAVVALAFGNSQPAVEMIVAALKESEYDSGLDLDLLFEIAEYWEGVREAKKLKRGVTSLMHMEVFSHQVPGGMLSNLVSQLELQNAKDRLPDVLKEIPKVRAEVGYPPLVTPMSQIVGTQAVINVLTGKRWAVVPQEMKDYLRGYYGKAPGPLDQEIVTKVLGQEVPLGPDVRPGSLVTTTYEEMAEEIGDLAHSEEDVLMYALFPNEARIYLEKHKEGAERAVFLMGEEANTVREADSVDVNQIKELVKLLEASDVSEIIIEEGDSKVIVRKAGTAGAAAAPAAAPASPAPAATAEGSPAPAAGERPASWKTIVAPMVGTIYRAGSPGAAPFVEVGDAVSEGQTLCILEAMKLMNEITAEESGVIREIVADNAQAVEYGTVLFYYEPVV
ncbi:MAG: acetyl-CoA carboxylase biotin carboxyl carrier protein [Actinobacteria bacterium HGW-Actinobacteria-6]|nr:MAG: acetyl-CoA carboxylase biotin carboxyl carrier protein [Actinobacteria bacterium HGW-Actinobacteria-6]